VRVAILHYHLRPGGVTRVIELAADALTAAGVDVLVIAGEAQPASGRLAAGRVAVVPALAYGEPAGEADVLRREVSLACRRIWGGEADVLHTHNHALGKNASFPSAVAAWAREGRAVLAQIHDFAEKARPANYAYLRGALGSPLPIYPHGGRASLAVLTRHASQLLGGGIPVVPNPIVPPDIRRPVSAAELGCDRFRVYPSRGLRRKNLGEFLLLASCAPAGTKFVVTSSPSSEADARVYSLWRKLAAEWGLPVVFDAAESLGRGVYDFLPAAEFAVTTSVEEGFGMAFLEPWLAGVGVSGRDLPDVTADFQSAGIGLSHLYRRLAVPHGIIDRSSHIAAAKLAHDAARAAYGLPPDPASAAGAAESAWDADGVDFSALPESGQITAIRAALDRKFEARIAAAPPGAITTNRAAIAQNFPSAAYGKRLLEIYGGLVSRPDSPPVFLDPEPVLRAALAASPMRFTIYPP